MLCGVVPSSRAICGDTCIEMLVLSARRTCAIRTRRAHHLNAVLVELPDAEVTQIDQRVGQRLERVVQIAPSVKA